jgi:excisionase family DNA binding protein
MTNLIEAGESLMTVAEVADFLRLHPNTVRVKIAAGTIPSIRLGDGPMAPVRIPRDQLEERLAAASSFHAADSGARGRAKSTSTARRGTNGNSNTGRQ